MFGTGGIRGAVGETIGTKLAIRLGRALGTHAESVVVGRDVRDSGPMLEHALLSGVTECGGSVIRVGVESTPTIARSVSWLDADFGVVITGSHNPAGDNGFKIRTHTGEVLGRDRYRSLVRRANAGTARSVPATGIGGSTCRSDLRERHHQHLLDTFDSIAGPSVVVDLGNGAGRLTADVLADLGCEVTTLNGHRDGSFPGRGSEPTAAACRRLAHTVRATGADLGIAHDADADRLAAVDETGRFVPGDELFALFATEAARRGRGIALTVDTSSLVAEAVSEVGGETVRTGVGEMAVATGLDSEGIGFGGEPSGLWIWDDEIRCPDAHFAACKLVALIQREGPLSAQLAPFTDRYTTHRACLDASAKHDAIDRVRRRLGGDYDRIDTTDGIRIDTDDGWFLIRASGTEPVVRITADAADRETADRLFGRAERLVEATALSV
ncbi:phosphoglucosamine mutase [Halohasta litorea]|uniref:Phosphoglucosamine mutase n=1 Tax=Halohasta litorea TaxID=869891 RepID=A0ABD6D870_9EURY|nr:phosphoglucosamine mutase [Halohasta litorea]